MSATLNLGGGKWATKEGSLLAYNSENNNYKPLPFTFDRASSATRVNKEGLIETVGADQPRIDFQGNTNGALLLEPSRTNLATYSEDFSDSYWTKSGSSSVTPNTTISPDGTLNADTISNATGTSTSDTVYRTINPDDVDHTFSAYVKSSGATTMSLILRNGISGVILSQAISLTSEWQRVTLTHNIQNGQIIFGNSDGDFHLWGAQLEQGSYATSYIPTQGSAVTRLADSCSQTPPDGVIGQTEGTLFLEFNSGVLDGEIQGFSVNDGTSQNRIVIFKNQNDRVEIQVRVGGVVQSAITSTDLSANTNYKAAVSYASNNVAFYLNGAQVGTDNTATIPACTDVCFDSDSNGGSPFYKDTKQATLFNERLSNAELAALTT